MEEYNFSKIESKWQKIWEESHFGAAKDFDVKKKFYNLCEFPYPSGDGLHVGHCMAYGATDAFGKYKLLQGFNVMTPIGWDAFGLPTENYAIKNRIKPAVATAKNIETFRAQMKSIGYTFDWERQVNTTDPSYYRWTQWIFLQFYKHGIIDNKLVEIADDDTTTPRLAYQAEMPVNWCPSCKVVLANEEIIGGKCERCGTLAEKRNQKQWMLRITAYADKLIEGLDNIDFPEQVKTQQKNWIGRSTGSIIEFRIKNTLLRQGSVGQAEFSIKVFTTRADTLFGCTYVVLAPESPLLESLMPSIQNKEEVHTYIQEAKNKSDLERTDLVKDKSGVKLEGLSAINPINSEPVDIYIADYVLANYGTGAVMAVPAHDERDWEFAKKYDIEIKNVVIPKVVDTINPPKAGENTVERRAIQAILIDPKTDKVLMLKWKKFPWTTFITGGVEENEDIIEGAKREIAEETGYTNIKYVRTLGGPVESHFYANHKSENRKALFSALVFELIDDHKNDIDESEKAIHELAWMTWEEIACDKNLICSEYKIWLDRFFNPEHAFVEYGVLSNSGEFDGLTSEEGKKAITEKLKEFNAGDFTVNYKLRDWIFSRQHYWGEPIPIIHCDKCGTLPVPEDQLPITLPEVENYEPSDNGESPLSAIDSWVNVSCPHCGGQAKRETDTMPNWAGSSWYYLAYAMQAKYKSEIRISKSETNTKFQNIFDKYAKELEYWMDASDAPRSSQSGGGVDIYNGGPEHITLHLLYSRFWHKFLYDLGAVNTPEPYQKRVTHGMILGPDNQKMSKSRGNVINPDDIIKTYGADTLRAYIMFIGPYDQDSTWNTSSVQGVSRFIKRVWSISQKIKDIDMDSTDSKEILIKINQAIVSITDDFENFHFNTIISRLMEVLNVFEKTDKVSRDTFQKYLILMFPVAPHISSEIWQNLKYDGHLCNQAWSKADAKYLIADEIEIVVQINGKVREKIQVSSGISEEELKKKALDSAKIKELLAEKEIIKVIVVPKKLVSIVVR